MGYYWFRKNGITTFKTTFRADKASCKTRIKNLRKRGCDTTPEKTALKEI